MINDLTKGAPLKLMLLFSIPLLIGNIFQQFYNIADIIIVGRTLGMTALASVGAVSSRSKSKARYAVILKTLFSSVGLDLPWPFYKEGDIRTINNYVLPTKVKNKPKTHDALSDAAWNMSVLNAFFEHKNKVATLLDNDCGIRGKEVSELKSSKNQLLPIY